MSLEESAEVHDDKSESEKSNTSTLSKDASRKLANIKENIRHNFSTLTKKPHDTVVFADKNEPSRFLGEGVSYRAKLIGILEVSEARGDRMCQEALADLKMAIRAAGEHKQRITINIAIDGLRLRDDKTGDCLYHHPVHKISFIAQDMTDSRAFGYIFGSPDTGHRFFGIKTDKAASQVVISMRDLFQVVFELKKKEIEMAKQHIEQHQIKYGMGILPETPQKVSTVDSGKMRTITEDSASGGSKEGAGGGGGEARKQGGGDRERTEGAASEAIADLLDLELELNSIQQGISQMERITPSDPFGDSFAPPVAAKLPPPPTKSSAAAAATTSTSTPSSSSAAAAAVTIVSTSVPPPPSLASAPAASATNKSWFSDDQESLFDEPDLPSAPSAPLSATPPTKGPTSEAEPTRDQTNDAKDQFDVFTELDPLGTGRSKPYIDKKDFFQELKNPPKKVLKDLVGEVPKETNPPLFKASFDSEPVSLDVAPATVTSASSAANALNSVIDLPLKQDPLFPVTISTDPFGDDPFDKTDPFAEPNLSRVFFPNLSNNEDPFDTCFADFTTFSQTDTIPTDVIDGSETKIRKSPLPTELMDGSSIHGPLRVSLPPEKQSSTSPRSRSRYSRTTSLVKLPSPKQKSRSSRISKQSTVDSAFERSGSPAMDGITLKNCNAGTPSHPGVGFLDSAPDPPPRPVNTTPIIKPPPLPPKRQNSGIATMKQPSRPVPFEYDYIENYETSSSSAAGLDLKSPPIPVPARRPRFGGTDGDQTAPQRPTKHAPNTEASEPEYYLTPFPLLPPPAKKNASPRAEPFKAFETNETLEQAKNTPGNTCSLDITLSQLTKTGFSDLAATLGMSPTSLSKMTLQELTKCLQKISAETENKNDDGKSSIRNSIFKSEQYSALRESIEEDVAPFKAEFDSHFNANTSETLNTQEESLFDKYAVFRELLEQEKKDTNEDEMVEQSVENFVGKEEEGEEGDADEDDDDEKSVMQDDSKIYPNNEVTESPSAPSAVSEDRYAALREISLDDFIQEEGEEGGEEKAETLKEMEEETEDGCPSRQHSESTESPTATMKEPQSIMETTIVEEDISALEADDDEVPEEVMGEMELSLPTVAESNESIDISDSPVHHEHIEMGSLPSLKEDLVEEPEEQPVNQKSSLNISNLVDGWAKFDNVEKTSEGNISPWSVDSKDLNKETYWRDRPDRPDRPERVERKPRKGRKHKVPQDDWAEDEEESEEGWRNQHSTWDDPPWRENGWSDGDSLYDEPPPVPYHTQRRGRRRRVSPWRKTSRDPSPWEDDERESQWEDPRWVEEYRPKHRGSSWDEERRKRRLSPWGGEGGDRRSSRESLAWEDDERYPRRTYRDRRHRDNRRWEEQGYGSRSSREYREQGRRNYQYYRDRSHDSPWEDSEQGEEDSPRCPARKQAWSGGSGGGGGGGGSGGGGSRHSARHDSEEEMYRYSRPDSRKSQTLRTNRYKKRGQTSPFEDDFSAHTFTFPNDSKSPGSDASEHYGKHSPVQNKQIQSSPDYFFKRKEFENSQQQSGGDVMVKTPQEGKPHTPKGNHRQSPFEDDFTPPETRRYSGRSMSSDASDKSCRKDDLKVNDDVFIPECKHKNGKQGVELSLSKRRGRNVNGELGQSGENMSPLSDGVARRVSERRHHHDSETMSPSGDVVGRHSVDKHHHLSEVESPSGETMRRRQGSDIKLSEAESPPSDVVRQTSRRQGNELKFRVSSLRRTDSSSSLRKSESVNIFACNSDPFDDDDFFSTDSSTLPRSTKDEKPKSSGNQDPFKWAEAFNAFNFENSSIFFDEERK